MCHERESKRLWMCEMHQAVYRLNWFVGLAVNSKAKMFTQPTRRTDDQVKSIRCRWKEDKVKVRGDRKEKKKVRQEKNCNWMTFCKMTGCKKWKNHRWRKLQVKSEEQKNTWEQIVPSERSKKEGNMVWRTKRTRREWVSEKSALSAWETIRSLLKSETQPLTSCGANYGKVREREREWGRTLASAMVRGSSSKWWFTTSDSVCTKSQVYLLQKCRATGDKERRRRRGKKRLTRSGRAHVILPQPTVCPLYSRLSRLSYVAMMMECKVSSYTFHPVLTVPYCRSDWKLSSSPHTLHWTTGRQVNCSQLNRSFKKEYESTIAISSLPFISWSSKWSILLDFILKASVEASTVVSIGVWSIVLILQVNK